MDSGVDASIFLGRPLAYTTKLKQGDQEKEVTSIKTLGLTTKVALAFGKPVVIYDDEEQIALKVTEM